MSHYRYTIRYRDHSRADIEAMFKGVPAYDWRFDRRRVEGDGWALVYVRDDPKVIACLADATATKVLYYEYPDEDGQTWDRIKLASNKPDLFAVISWIKRVHGVTV